MSGSLYMLDTNIASLIIKNTIPALRNKIQKVPMEQICISSITEAELLYGVAQKPGAKHLPKLVKEFLLRVEILPWDSNVAAIYAKFRNVCKNEGKALSSMDMLIAAHALSKDAILVTNDQSFFQLGHILMLENWVKM